MDVVSLVPSATETLLAWGVTPIAVTRFCEQPSLRPVGGTKDPDVPAIVALRPDLVVLCEEENRREDAEALTEAGLAIHVIRIDAVADVGPELDRLASALELERPQSARSSVPAPPTPRATAVVPIWRRPWMTMNAGTYGSSVLAHAGIANVFGADATRYPSFELEDAVALQPDVVVAPSEPYPFTERHRAELEQVAPVVFVDGQDLFWWGVRTAAAVARLRVQLETIRRAPGTRPPTA